MLNVIGRRVRVCYILEELSNWARGFQQSGRMGTKRAWALCFEEDPVKDMMWAFISYNENGESTHHYFMWLTYTVARGDEIEETTCKAQNYANRIINQYTETSGEQVSSFFIQVMVD